MHPRKRKKSLTLISAVGRRRLPGGLGGDDDDSYSGQLGAIFIAGELLLKRGRMWRGRESHHQTFLRGKKTASNRTAKFRIVFSIILRPDKRHDEDSIVS